MGSLERACITLTRGIRVGAHGLNPETIARPAAGVDNRGGEVIPENAFVQSQLALAMK